ncbi:MAG: DUF2851 family protein, partial [Chloroflexota bacterium]|nr:DUF2851 family protein [Chloroflexota bacterium]
FAVVSEAGRGSGEQRAGDVEFHVRSSDWFAHQHHLDARYNNVILHIVLLCDDSAPTLRQDGARIPVCSLYDLAPVPAGAYTGHEDTPASWPCHEIMQQMSVAERTKLLRLAGLLRFEQKVHTFVERLHAGWPVGMPSTGESVGTQLMAPAAACSAYDACLIADLAEALGYGRDRAFFQAVGLRLLGSTQRVPEPLGQAPAPAPLDARRLRILYWLVEQWRIDGAWQTFRQVLDTSTADEWDASQVLDELRAAFGALSQARADIVICNVVLPFAGAVALLENDRRLAARAEMAYLAHPGLASNQVTRAMCRQLQLQQEPRGACQQQGLHYIYRETCREKRCGECIVGKRDI